MSFVSQLSLQNFRNYDEARFENIQSGFVILHGANGAGKTNILEAISLLSPGRGIRSARVQDIQNSEKPSPWGLSSRIATDGGDVKIGTGLDVQTSRRTIRINGAPAKSQTALSDYVACVWLTPQMDRLFMESVGTRRRFLDRMVFTFDPGHSGRVARYENAMRQRAKLLEEGNSDPKWLSGIEAQMAETGIAISAARIDFIERLQNAIDKGEQNEEQFFPKARIHLKGTVEELLNNTPAVEAEKLLKYQLEESRNHDRQNIGTATGPHKTDMQVYFASRNMLAGQCSTGEQKALLIGLILAQARMMAAERGFVPILLLDEIAAHLDEERRGALFERLQALNSQVWMTGTDTKSFSAIANQSQFFEIENAQIVKPAEKAA